MDDSIAYFERFEASYGKESNCLTEFRKKGKLLFQFTDMNKSKSIALWGGAAVALFTGIFFIVRPSYVHGELDSFASCLGEKGAVFYGAFWCPHCQNQKKMFGKSEKKLPYVECSTSDGRSQLPICIEKKIEGYPTWEFADGSRLSGEIKLETLAEKTGCILP